MDIRSEKDFLELLDQFFPRKHGQLSIGRGDDCAVLNLREDICLTSDLFLQDVHFKLEYFSPEDIGYKALAVNISDILAMGAKPLGFQLNLMVPPDLGIEFWSPFFSEMSKLAEKLDMALAGGDISRWDKLGIDITMWGKSKNRYLQRGQSQIKDKLFLIGEPGLAKVGLMVLEQGFCKTEYPKAVQAHLRPELFYVQAGQLALEEQIRGLMDVSDGLAQDLPRFLRPDLGADLFIQEQDLDPELVRFAKENNQSPLDLALSGGEDYALLGSAQPEGIMELKKRMPEIKIIGQVTSQPGIYILGRPYRDHGFDHFEAGLTKPVSSRKGLK